MRRPLLIGLAAVCVAVALGTIALRVAFPPSRLLQLAEQRAGQALGTPVRIGGVGWTLFGAGGLRPTLALREIGTPALSPAITVASLEVRPSLRSLVRGRFDVAEATIETVELPQAAIDAVLAARRKAAAAELPPGDARPSAPGASAPPVVDRLVLRNVAWQRADGLRAVLQAVGSLQADHLAVDTLTVAIAGGTVAGSARLDWNGAPAAPGPVRLRASLRAQDVEVAQLVPPAMLHGKLEASTAIEATAAQRAGLPTAIVTRSSFVVRQATIEGIDLARATSATEARGGHTSLDTLRGELATHGLPPAMSVRMTALEARSGPLSARGEVGVSAQQALEGRIVVDVAGAPVGVPLRLGGTLASPSVSPLPEMLLDAAAGAAIAPGTGTAAGARPGDSVSRELDRLLGGR